MNLKKTVDKIGDEKATTERQELMKNQQTSQADQLIKDALKEDVGIFEDFSTNAVFSNEDTAEFKLIAKANGVLAQKDVFERVFEIVSLEEFKNEKSVEIKWNFKNGEKFGKGDKIATLKGKTRVILTGERVALNLLGHLCSVATETSKIVDEIRGTRCALLDTRKTTPLLRRLEKNAVLDGGGQNHRFDLSSAIMLKDNHIAASGSITEAVKRAKEYCKKINKKLSIEVEVEDIFSAFEAVKNDVDIVMLDNMKPDEIAKTLKEVKGFCHANHFSPPKFEASGNITWKNAREYAQSGVDFISSGSITHSVPAIDLSLKQV